MTVKIGIHGSEGKMGKAVAEAISTNNDFTLVAKFSRNNVINNLSNLGDIIIDFSSPEAIPNLLKYAIKGQTNILIGTTGLSPTHISLLKQAAKSIAVLYAPNTSIGANLIIEIAGSIAKVLTKYDVEVIDLHHRHKKDAPSGTALAIGQSIASARSDNFEDVAIINTPMHYRKKDGEIGFSSLRCGGIYGEHEVLFANSSEVVTLGVKALSRSVFAEGALFGAKWLLTRKVGLYSMMDVLNFKK